MRVWWETNEHDIHALMYPITCTHHRLHSNGNKNTVLPGYIWHNWQNMMAKPPQTHKHGKIWQQWERLIFWLKCSLGDRSFIRKWGHYFTKNLTCLPRIFRFSSLNLHTFHFDGEFSSVSMASRPPKIGKTTMFWSPTLWSWRHNAGARELSANRTL